MSTPKHNEAKIAQSWETIDALDFTQIKRRLTMYGPEGDEMRDKVADNAILWYRRFLKIAVKYPDTRVVPNHHIDCVWHRHILDTQTYIPDSNKIFGSYFHHYPYFGMNNDERKRDDAFAETNSLYMEEFGEAPKNCGASSYCEAGCHGETDQCPSYKGTSCGSICDVKY